MSDEIFSAIEFSLSSYLTKGPFSKIGLNIQVNEFVFQKTITLCILFKQFSMTRITDFQYQMMNWVHPYFEKIAHSDEIFFTTFNSSSRVEG